MAKIPEKFKDLIEKIEKLSVLELAELVKILEEKFGVSTQAVVAAPTVAAPTEVKKEEEKISFDVELTEVGPNKIGVIKIVRDLSGKGLKDAKDLVDTAPKIIKEKVTKEEAEEIKKKLEGVGAKVTLK